MLKQSLWIIGFFLFGKLIYNEFIILKYRIHVQNVYTQMKRTFENVYRLSSMVVPNPYQIPNLCPLTVILSFCSIVTSCHTVGTPW